MNLLIIIEYKEKSHKNIICSVLQCSVVQSCCIHECVAFAFILLVQAYLTDLEMLAILLAAIIHDVDHPGTTNPFQIAHQ